MRVRSKFVLQCLLALCVASCAEAAAPFAPTPWPTSLDAVSVVAPDGVNVSAAAPSPTPRSGVGEYVVAGAEILPEGEGEAYAAEAQGGSSEIAEQWERLDGKLELRELDRKALEIAKAFEAAKHAPAPVAGTCGRIVYTFGSVSPRIVCRPFRVTDVQLEPGEKVTATPDTGDPVRWSISPSMSVENGKETVHVMIKPSMPEISTNLTIHTDRRTYLLELTSEETNYMPFVSFFYPEALLSDWNACVRQYKERKVEEEETLRIPSVTAENLDFDYRIKGEAPWKPVRVFNDGTKTYVEMPKMASSEAPALLIYEGKQRKIVNYRVSNKFYIVDRLFEKGVLLAGKSKVVLVHRGND